SVYGATGWKVGRAVEPADLIAGAPLAFLSAGDVPQAGAFSVRVNRVYADVASAMFNARRIELVPAGDYLLGVFGAGQPVDTEIELDPGAYTVRIAVQSAMRGSYTVELALQVVAHDFPVDAVTLPPSLNGLLSPDVAAHELATLRDVYTTAPS